MEQVKKYNEVFHGFLFKYRDVLSKSIFEDCSELKKAKLFEYIFEGKNHFPIFVPYSTEIYNKYKNKAIWSFKRAENDSGRFVTTVFQKSKTSYVVFNLCLFRKNNNDDIVPYINVDIFSDNSVKDYIEFVEDNKEFEDYSLIEDERRLGLG